MSEMKPGVAGEPMLPSLVRVRGRRRETADTFTLRLSAPRGAAALGRFEFQPGQFNMLYVFGVGEAPISLSGDPARSDALVHTIRAVGSVTGALANLRRGDAIGLRGPYGSGWPLEAATGRDVLIVTGGLGLAPLRPALYQILANRARFGRVSLLYGARSPADLLYAAELNRWSRRAELQVLVTVDHADVTWRGPVGVVTALMAQADVDAASAVAMVCGPEVMMRFALRGLERLGIPHERVYLSLERNMQCAIGFCGHCQFGPNFVCRDGPVFRRDRIHEFFEIREA